MGRVNSIRTNVAALNAMKNIEHNTKEMGDEYNRLSSGKRITKAADDPVGLAIGSKLEAKIRSYGAARKNTDQGISLLQTAEGSLNEIQGILIRLRELGIQAASDTSGDDERNLLNIEYQLLMQEVDRIADTTEYNGVRLLNGANDKDSLRFHVGPTSDEANAIEFETNAINVKTDELGIDGLSVEELDSAVEGLEAIDNALFKVSSYRAELGGTQRRLQHTVGHLDNMKLSHQKAKAVIEDTDLAETSTNLVNMRVLQEAGLSTLSGAHRSKNNLIRLLG